MNERVCPATCEWIGPPDPPLAHEHRCTRPECHDGWHQCACGAKFTEREDS